MEAHASDLAMTQQPDRQLDPSLPNAARMQAIGDLLARGIRRLNDMKRQKAREEIHDQVPTTCLDLQPESSVTVPDAETPRMQDRRQETE